MPHISKDKLSKSQEKEIYQQLLDILAPQHQLRGQRAIGELLTHTEKIMLAKRCAVVALCSKGVSPYRIGDVLSLSQSTAARISAKYEQGKYENLVDFLNRQRNTKLVFSIIDRFVRTFPKYNGRRWDWLNDK